MSGVLRAIVDLRRGEAAEVARAGGALAALIAGHTVLETARDALFLQELPVSRLAIVYAAMAVLALGAVHAGAWLVRRLGRRGALIASLGGASLGTAAFALVPTTPTAVMALYLWTGLVATVVLVQFWLVVGGVFTPSQGRRSTPAIATAGALGAFLGAAAASLLAREIDVRHLVPVAAGLFAVAAGIVRGMPAAAAPATPPRRGDRRMIGHRGYVRRLALLVGLSAAALLAADYLFEVTVAGVLLAQGADGLLRHSLHRVSLELLWIPLPEDVRGRVREPIDGVIVRAAQAIAAGGLFAIAPAGAAAPAVLAAIVAGLALLWLLAASAMRGGGSDSLPRHRNP